MEKGYTNLSNSVGGLVINSDGHIFAGLKGGPKIIYSTDNGDTWSEFNTGLTALSVEYMVINSNDVIFGGTVSNGVFRTSAPTTSIEESSAEQPSSFAMEQNYPNPFNPTTIIQFAVAKQSRVTVKVFDMLGREVATVVNAALAPSIYKVNFDADDLPNGVYFYRLQAGQFSQTKKLILLK